MDLSNSQQFEAGNDNSLLHFYHANGFPLAVYQPILDALSRDYNVGALANRATWPKSVEIPSNRNWQIYADDLISFLERQNQGPVVGVGHSMGATCTVLAAIKRPDLFSKLVLIEPAMVSKPLSYLVKAMPKKMMNKINPAKGTLTKQDRFESREIYKDYIQKFNGYKNFSPEMFQRFSEHAIVESEDSNDFSLAFSKEWEAHNYTQPPNVMNEIAKLKMPCVAIRAKPSIFFTEKLWQQWQKLQPNTVFLENLNQGHLLPLEVPENCAELILDGLKQL